MPQVPRNSDRGQVEPVAKAGVSNGRVRDKSGVGLRCANSDTRFPLSVVVLVLALAGLGSPGSDMLAAYGKVPDLLNFMDYPRQWVALRRLKHGALNVGADLLLIVVVIVIPTCLWFLAAHFVFQSLGRPEC